MAGRGLSARAGARYRRWKSGWPCSPPRPAGGSPASSKSGCRSATGWRRTGRAFPPLRIGRFFLHGSHWSGPAPAGAMSLEIDAADSLWHRRASLDPRLPAGVGQAGAPPPLSSAARHRHRQRRSCDCRRQDAAPAGAGERHRLRRGAGCRPPRPAQRPARPGAPRLRPGIPRPRRAPLALRFGLCQHPGASAGLMARDLKRALAPGGVAILVRAAATAGEDGRGGAPVAAPRPRRAGS